MKKIILSIVCAVMSVCAFAQKGATQVGVNVNYGTKAETFSFGVKGSYGFTDAIRAEASFNQSLKKDGVSMYDINLNAHYLFSLGQKFKVYPLVGLTYVHSKLDWKSLGDFDDYEDYLDWKDYMDEEGAKIDDSASKFGVNLGGGVQYDITSNLVFNAEVKYSMVSDFDQCVIGLGLSYRF